MGVSISLAYTYNGNDIASNTSSVTITATLKWTYGTWNNSAMAGALIIDGTAYNFSTNFNWNGASTNGSKELITKTVNVSHNSDGTKKLNYSAYYEYHTEKVVEAADSKTLPDIPRVSQPSCVTWPEHTQNVGNFGDTISIHMNRKASSITHRVSYTFGSEQGLIAENVGTGTTWKIPLSLMNLIPDSVSGSGTIWVESYAGGKQIGISSCGFTATVPDSVKPSCTISLDDVSNVDNTYGSPVQGLSRIKVTVSATTAYSSPIVSYTVEANGVTYSGSTITTGVLQNSGSSPVVVTVRDQRGRTGTASYTMSVQAYSAPAVSKLNIKRSNADGTENDKGAYIHVTFSAAISSLNSKNTAAYALRYKKSTDSTYTTVSFSALANKYTVTDQTYRFAADPDYSYDIEVTATDRHSTGVRSTSGSTAFTLMDWKASGRGIAFGKVSEKDDTMEIALAAEIHGSAILHGNRYSFSTPGTAGSAGYILLARIAITAANADTPITFVLSQRQKETTMTVYAQFRNSTATTSTLQSIRYTGSNYGAFLVPNGSLTWDLYVQKGSNYDTITLQDWYTSQTMESRVDITFHGTLVSSLPQPYYRATPAKLDSLVDFIFPVNSVYISYSHTSPAELFGGTWTRIQNNFLWATTSGGTIGQTGGEQNVTLTTNQMPSHNHAWQYSTNNGSSFYAAYMGEPGRFEDPSYLGISHAINELASYQARVAPAGGGQAHNNMPPYIQVSVWRRTA